MARFLSPEWFAEIASHGNRSAPEALDEDSLVIEQIVEKTPFGEVHYTVVLTAESTWLEQSAREADLTIRSDWDTAVAIARGTLPAQRALLDGRLQVRGNLAKLRSADPRERAGDPVPAVVRATTSY